MSPGYGGKSGAGVARNATMHTGRPELGSGHKRVPRLPSCRLSAAGRHPGSVLNRNSQSRLVPPLPREVAWAPFRNDRLPTARALSVGLLSPPAGQFGDPLQQHCLPLHGLRCDEGAHPVRRPSNLIRFASPGENSQAKVPVWCSTRPRKPHPTCLRAWLVLRSDLAPACPAGHIRTHHVSVLNKFGSLCKMEAARGRPPLPRHTACSRREGERGAAPPKSKALASSPNARSKRLSSLATQRLISTRSVITIAGEAKLRSTLGSPLKRSSCRPIGVFFPTSLFWRGVSGAWLYNASRPRTSSLAGPKFDQSGVCPSLGARGPNVRLRWWPRSQLGRSRPGTADPIDGGLLCKGVRVALSARLVHTQGHPKLAFRRAARVRVRHNIGPKSAGIGTTSTKTGRSPWEIYMVETGPGSPARCSKHGRARLQFLID